MKERQKSRKQFGRNRTLQLILRPWKSLRLVNMFMTLRYQMEWTGMMCQYVSDYIQEMVLTFPILNLHQKNGGKIFIPICMNDFMTRVYLPTQALERLIQQESRSCCLFFDVKKMSLPQMGEYGINRKQLPVLYGQMEYIYTLWSRMARHKTFV